MNQPAFIGIYNTKDEAMYYMNSPQMTTYNFDGVQLLPNNPYPYIQQTNAEGGITGDILTVQLFDLCDNLLANITSSFASLDEFVDSYTGLNQLRWQLSNIPYDAHGKSVYIRFTLGGGGYYYSNPFGLTRDNEEYTSRWDYRNRTGDYMLSTQLPIWYKYPATFKEIASYDGVTVAKRFTSSFRLIPYEVWGSNIVDIELFGKIDQVFRNRFVYIGGLRTDLFELYDNPVPEGRENFGEVPEIKLQRDKKDIYTPPINPSGRVYVVDDYVPADYVE